MIFVSTGGFRDRAAAAVAWELYRVGLKNIELSGGAYSENYLEDLLGMPDDAILQVHNYFPPPPKPFIFNLASENEFISQLSIAQVRGGMRLAYALGRPIYSFHAGFRLDPDLSEIGKNLISRKISPRKLALQNFYDRVCVLSREASDLGVTLLIENNVITKNNYTVFQDDPLLLTAPCEILDFFSSVPNNVQFLLDVAHLKVSSVALNFDLLNAHEKLLPLIKAYHLSDNCGLYDSNKPIQQSSWFMNRLKTGLNYYSIEVYGLNALELRDQVSMINQSLN